MGTFKLLLPFLLMLSLATSLQIDNNLIIDDVITEAENEVDLSLVGRRIMGNDIPGHMRREVTKE